MSVTFHPLEWLHILRERRQYLHRCEILRNTAIRVIQTILTHNSEKSYPTQEETAEYFFVVITIVGETNK